MKPAANMHADYAAVQGLLTGEHVVQVLQVQSDFPGRDRQPLWAQAPSDDKIIAYNALQSALRALYPSKIPSSRANKSKDTAMAEVMRQLRSNSSYAAVGSGQTHQFGTPEAAKAYRQRGIQLRKAAEEFLRSDRCHCTAPGTAVFNSLLATIRAVLADALWLAMYDVQQQLKATRKRPRGADGRGQLYKANKRPVVPSHAAAAAAEPISLGQELHSAGSETPCPGTAQLTPDTPVQRPPQRQRRRAAAAAAARLIDLTADDDNESDLPGCMYINLTQHSE
jgi:hypothetical protein